MNLITDRTEADVFESKRLNRMKYNDMTAEEKARFNENKGSYQYTDLNRVGEACAELYDALTAAGYDPWYYGYSALKTNWTNTDRPTFAQLQQYISTLHSIKDTLGTIHPLPLTMRNLTYEGANNIEKMLLKVEMELNNMIPLFPKSGMYESGIVLYIPDYQSVAPALPEVVPDQTVTVPSSGIIYIPYSAYADTWGNGWRGIMRKTIKVTLNGEDWYLPPCYTNAGWTEMDMGTQAWGEFYNSPTYTYFPAFVYATDMEEMRLATYLTGEITYSIHEVEYDDRPNYISVARNQVVFTSASAPHTARLQFGWVDTYGGGTWANATDTLRVTVNNAFRYTLPPCPSPYTYGYDAWGACNNYAGGSLPPDFATCPICIYKDGANNIIIETENQDTMTVLVEVQE